MIDILLFFLIFIFSMVLFRVFKYLGSPSFKRKWRVAFILLSIVGVMLGYWSSTSLEISIGDKGKVGGFPIPLVVFVDEGEGDSEVWIDFVPPTYIQLLGLLSNILIVTSVLVTLLFITGYITKRRTRLLERHSIEPAKRK